MDKDDIQLEEVEPAYKEPDDNEEEDWYLNGERTTVNPEGSKHGTTKDETDDEADLDVDVEKVLLFLRLFTVVL